MKFNTVEEALDELRAGKIILVTDDEDRENEGDFICAAEFATTENINFMAMHGKGLICMPMSQEYVKKLRFPQMVQENTDNHETAFTVSIDHVSTTTGISAAERSITAMKCVSDDAKPDDFRRPGHMFPLLAKKNGVLERNGHTEATVDLCRLAGLKECGLCCEIMREDGTMMRTTELMELAKKWDIKFITIAALQEYRKIHEKLVDRVTEVKLPTKYGEFKAYGFVNRLNGEHHVALVVDLVLDDLRGETGERCVALAEFPIHIIHFDALVSDGAALALEREATFRRIERAVFGGDVWIEHHENAAAEILIHKSDDALGNADHIGRHAHATIAMRVQRVFQVLRHGQILFGVLGCGGRLAQKWDGRHDLTLHVIPLVGCCRSANIVASHGCETDGWANLSIP